VQLLLDIAGATVCAAPAAVSVPALLPAAAPPVAELGPGQARQAHGSECFAALAELSMASPQWRQLLWAEVTSALERLGVAAAASLALCEEEGRAAAGRKPGGRPAGGGTAGAPPQLCLWAATVRRAIAEAGVSLSEAQRAVAAAALIAGPVEILRVGARVRVRPVSAAAVAGEDDEDDEDEEAGEGVVLAIGRSLYGELRAAEAVASLGAEDDGALYAAADAAFPVDGVDGAAGEAATPSAGGSLEGTDSDGSKGGSAAGGGAAGGAKGLSLRVRFGTAGAMARQRLMLARLRVASLLGPGVGRALVVMAGDSGGDGPQGDERLTIVSVSRLDPLPPLAGSPAVALAAAEAAARSHGAGATTATPASLGG